MRKRRFVSFISLLLILSGSITLTLVNTTISRAAVVTWDGGGADNNWSTCANWETDTCPTSADTVIFNATSTKDATVDASFTGTIISLTIDTNYTGTITLARSLQTTGAFTQAGGTFTAGSQTLDVNGAFALSGGIFNASSDIMTFASTFTISGSPTFNANGGIVAFDGSSSAINCNNVTFNRVTIVSLSSSTKTIGSTCNLPLGANPSIRPVTLNGTLSGSGTLTITNTNNVAFNTGASLVGFTGLAREGNLIIAGATIDLGSYTTVDINGSFVINSGTFTAPSNEMFVGGSLQFTGGTFDANGGTVTFDTASNSYIDCQGAPFNIVKFSSNSQGFKTIYNGCTIPLGNNATITPGTLVNKGTLSGTGTLTTTNLRLDSTSVLTGFSGLVVNGTFDNNGATTNLSGYTTADFNDTFTVTSGTFTAPTSAMSVASDFTYVGGEFITSTGTLTFDGTNGTIDCDSIRLNNKIVFNHTGTKTVADPCDLPLGANPTIPSAISLSGTLRGTGTLTQMGDLTFNAFASLANFTSIRKPSGNFIIAGGDFNTTTNNFNTIDLDGSFILNSGTFTAPKISMTVGGDFTHTGGTFSHNNGSIILDGSNQIVSGSSAFYNLTKTTNSTTTLTFANGTTQTVTNSLTLQGSAGHLLSLVSDNGGQQWNIDPSGTRTLAYLNVRDSRNTNATVITAGSTVTDGGNNTNWTFSAPPSSDDEDDATSTATASPSPSSSLSASPSPTPTLKPSPEPSLQSTSAPSTESSSTTTTTESPTVTTPTIVPHVVIRTLGSNGQSITGAKVGLYSTPRSAISDTNGVAVFEDIEAGEHQLIVAYRDKIAIQRLTVNESGDIETINASANSTTNSENKNELIISLEDSSPLVPVMVLIMSRVAAGFLTLLAYLLYIRRRPDLDYLGLGGRGE